MNITDFSAGDEITFRAILGSWVIREIDLEAETVSFATDLWDCAHVWPFSDCERDGIALRNVGL